MYLEGVSRNVHRPASIPSFATLHPSPTEVLLLYHPNSGSFTAWPALKPRLTPAQLHLGAPLGLSDELDLRQSAHPAAGHEHPVTGTQNPPRALVTEPWPISVPTAASPYVIAAPRAPTPIAGAPDIAATRTRPALDTKGRRRTAGSAERLRSGLGRHNCGGERRNCSAAIWIGANDNQGGESGVAARA